MFVFSAQAQDSKLDSLHNDAANDTVRIPHLKFQGFEIDGPLVDYMHKLDTKGFKNVGIEKGVGIQTANIEGYKNCIVNSVSGNANTNVYLVSVCYTYANSADDLESGYQSMKQSLSAKFGSPVAEDDDTFEEFIYPGYEKAWRNTSLIKDCLFENEIGLVKLAIFQRGVYTLSIVMIDKHNYKKATGKEITASHSEEAVPEAEE